MSVSVQAQDDSASARSRGVDNAAASESATAEGATAPEGDAAGTGAESEGASPEEADATDETQLTFDEEAPAGAEAENLRSFTTWDFVRMVLVLAAVIGAIYGVFWLLKRGSRGRLQNSQMIRVLGSHALPGNKGLHIVEIGTQIFLVGTGDDSVRLIAEITDQESVDEVRLAASQQEAARPKSFGEALSGFFNGGTNGAGMNGSTALGATGSSPGVSNAGPLDFLHKQRERLRNLK
ncbi:MAG: flagellar biosynthetic protein FliO [Spirochaetota bacterium]